MGRLDDEGVQGAGKKPAGGGKRGCCTIRLDRQQGLENILKRASTATTTATMALRATSRRIPGLLRPRAVLGWGGALAVGLVAVNCNWRSIAGDIRVASGTLRCRTFPFSRSLATARLNLFSFPAPAMSITPPQPAPVWNHTPEDITRLNNEYIATHRAKQDEVGALAPKDCTFASVSLLVSSPILCRSSLPRSS